MRRLAAIVSALVAGAGLVAFGSAAGGEEGTYLVRAIFDNGGFLVAGEDVRIAGATVGSVDSVDVSGVDEPVTEDGKPDPGKAVIVLAIEDPGFQDFREDAGCIIRPQSLLGEKFVECTPTQPHAPDTEPPPELAVIPEGEPGAGQRLLPLENNGKAVDLDLVNDIMREPYPDRFRLIINDLGAGLAARGKDLAAIVERANPALRRTDEVLAILAKQNRQLAELARDGDRVLGPLAGQRQHIGGFINNANTTAVATAERSGDLESGLQRLPAFLRELRATMGELDNFATQSTPVVADLGDVAPELTDINRALGPFADAGTRSLKSLGNAVEQTGPDLVASEPVLGDVKGLAKSALPVAQTLAKLLKSLRQSGGYKYLTQVVFNAAGAVNAFDSFGHFLRTVLPINNCVTYEVTPGGGGGPACDANFTGDTKAAKIQPSARAIRRAVAGLPPYPQSDSSPPQSGDVPAADPTQQPPSEEPPSDDPAQGDAGSVDEPPTEATLDMRDTRLLLDYFIGRPERPKHKHHDRRGARR